MKKLIISALVVASSMMVAQSNWKFDASHSKIGFSITHMTISEVEGRLKVYDGKVVSKSTKDFTDATVQFLGDAGSINTDDEKRDGHLKSADFFDVEKFPKIAFVSTSMKPGKVAGSYIVEGDLTIKGITKKVTFTGTYNGTTEDPYKNTKSGFSLKGKIKRSEFNVGASMPAAMLSEDVVLDLKVELTLQK